MMSPLSICGLHIVKDSEMQNFGFHGTVGSGKSTALNDLLRQLRERGDRVIVYDKGNNFIPTFFRQDKDLILNPFDERCAPWDLWEECRTIGDFENFATSLLPDSSGSSDPFWVLSARSLFVATARRMAREKKRSIGELLKKLMSISLADLRQFLEGTRLADRVDQDLTADARFMAGKTPEMLWPVINEHGRQRGNWHVPVSPSSGEVNFSAAHYEGAADGSRIVLQRGEKHGKVLEAADVAEALQLMKDNPDSPVVLSADHSERSGDKGAPAEAATATSGGEELDRREAEALEKAVRAAHGEEEKEQEPVVQDDARSAPDDRESEREAALEELQEEEAFDYRDYDLSPEREERSAMMNDEVNVMRHERSEPEPEFGHKPQKTLE
ncbi:type IV secretion system DNA-binding domain-containing protein [Pantoea agglomerans]|uniref:type IV secretion system DNA-binding domain-containing protein n=1 Tax=Enterobacter agglomerans TaxID=549 RepID=UPI0017867259|nr:type IV secretion system DNA-binding domain-containing protein [Pantoea agglomerans]MBD8184355.1 type IV secretion system DNA-binding domain-containing protein [Pantoea agglomerans]